MHNPTTYFYTKKRQKEKRIPAPSHRHAAPSAPWPWIDIHNGMCRFFFTITTYHTASLPAVDPVQLASGLPPVPPICDHKSCDGCWKGYPQSRFPNWTKDQVARSKISEAITNYHREKPCVVYRADVRDDGFFENVDPMTAFDGETDAIWEQIIHTEVRALF